MRFRLSGLAALAAIATSVNASATYSIVAADTATRQVGGAGTSCLRGSNVYIIYGSVPGAGAVHAQATFNQAGRDRAVDLLELGTAPDEIISELVEPSFDADAAIRQYAVVDVSGKIAGFTGADDRDYADDRQGSVATFHYSTQGNILTSERVLAQAASAFEGAGCDLAERLLLALEAGAENGEGDSRCTDSRDIPSDSAFLQVDRPDETRGSYLELHVPTSGNDNPLVALREQFDSWRESHPCPDGVGGQGGSAASGAGGNESAGQSGQAGAGLGGNSTGTGGQTRGGAAGFGGISAGGKAGDAAGAGTSGTPPASGSAGTSSAGAGAVSGAAGAAGGETPRDPAGCACGFASASDSRSASLLALMLLAVRRRFRRVR